jgi:hypothetical protein
MTFNRDPNAPLRDRLRVRRDDGSWSALPILLVVAIVLGAGVMIYTADWNASTNRPIGEPTARPAPPATSTPPATMPPTGPRQ